MFCPTAKTVQPKAGRKLKALEEDQEAPEVGSYVKGIIQSVD